MSASYLAIKTKCIYIILGDVTKLTPRKIYDRHYGNKLCRLCGKAIDSTKYGRLFGKAAESKKLCERIKLITDVTILETSGVTILETSGNSEIICRNCERLLEKCMQFRTDVQKTQKLFDAKCSVKRVITPPKIYPSQKLSRSSINFVSLSYIYFRK